MLFINVYFVGYIFNNNLVSLYSFCSEKVTNKRKSTESHLKFAVQRNPYSKFAQKKTMFKGLSGFKANFD